MDWLLSWPRAGVRAFTHALIDLRPTLRRLLPRRLHHATGQAARWFIRSIEAAGAGAEEIDAFAPAAAPLFKPEAFAAGPILHTNTALAWGGADLYVTATTSLYRIRDQRSR